MKFTANLTEWQLRTIAASVEFYADHVDGDELEQLLNLSLLRQMFLRAADESLEWDKRAIRQEYGI